MKTNTIQKEEIPMLTLKPAASGDADAIFSIICQGQKHLKDQGIDQWQNGYPDKARIEQDICEQIGYLITDGSDILGYLCIVESGEPAYDQIDGAWLTKYLSADCQNACHTQLIPGYAVIHRIVLSDNARGKGLSGSVFARADDFCRTRKIPALRIDTHTDNHKMQHVLSKSGFTFCGIVEYTSGLRRAYEKLL